MTTRVQNAMLLGEIVSEEARKAQVHLWVWCFAIFCLLISHLALFVAGLLSGIERGRDFEREKQAMTPRAVVPAPANALTQWSCSRQEAREYLFACRSRDRMERVK